MYASYGLSFVGGYTEYHTSEESHVLLPSCGRILIVVSVGCKWISSRILHSAMSISMLLLSLLVLLFLGQAIERSFVTEADSRRARFSAAWWGANNSRFIGMNASLIERMHSAYSV